METLVDFPALDFIGHAITHPFAPGLFKYLILFLSELIEYEKY